jgi:hypothetical protein
MSIDGIDVGIAVEVDGYAPDVLDDIKKHSIDAAHELMHMRACGGAPLTNEEGATFLSRMLGDSDE